MQTNKFCQSCGMPFTKDPQGGGTNADGTKSVLYCSYCFQNGQFVRPEIDTPEKMQKLVKEKLKEMHVPGFMAWFFALGVPRLGRWRKVYKK